MEPQQSQRRAEAALDPGETGLAFAVYSAVGHSPSAEVVAAEHGFIASPAKWTRGDVDLYKVQVAQYGAPAGAGAVLWRRRPEATAGNLAPWRIDMANGEDVFDLWPAEIEQGLPPVIITILIGISGVICGACFIIYCAKVLGWLRWLL